VLQELGALGANRQEVVKPLEDQVCMCVMCCLVMQISVQMMGDSNYLVQYEAAKALITLGNDITYTDTLTHATQSLTHADAHMVQVHLYATQSS